MARTETVAFNVGGTRFDVSKSLLAQYPDCILSRMIAQEWDDGSKEPLFLVLAYQCRSQVSVF